MAVDQVAQGYPNISDLENENAPYMWEVQFFLVVQASWYCHGICENLIYDRARGDFWMMMAHHIVAVGLTYGSFVGFAHRVGVHVTLFMDSADVWLYMCKMYHLVSSDYSGKPLSNLCFHGQTAGLAILALVWFFFRIIQFGKLIYVMNLYQDVFTVPRVGAFLDIQLAIMYGLQCVWGVYIWKLAISQAVWGKFEDTAHNDCIQKRIGEESDDDKQNILNNSSDRMEKTQSSGPENNSSVTKLTAAGSRRNSIKIESGQKDRPSDHSTSSDASTTAESSAEGELRKRA